MNGQSYAPYTGILKEEAGETISCVGQIGKEGMKETDELKFIVIIFSCLITKPVQLCLFFSRRIYRSFLLCHKIKHALT